MPTLALQPTCTQQASPCHSLIVISNTTKSGNNFDSNHGTVFSQIRKTWPNLQSIPAPIFVQQP